METTCREVGCQEEPKFHLMGPVHLCNTHFKAYCTDDTKPSMGAMFGPTTLEVLWDPIHGETVPDGLAMDLVRDKIREFTDSKGDMTHRISSCVVLTAYRVAVHRGYIEPFHIYIRGLDGNTHDMLNGGFPSSLPADCDHTCDLLMELL